MVNISKESFEATIDALLKAHPRNSAKGNDMKEWFKESFSLNAAVSNVKEDKQVGNRVAEQFKHKLPIVIFVCDKNVNVDNLISKAIDQRYSTLNILMAIVVSAEGKYCYDKLYNKSSDAFSAWAVDKLGVVIEPFPNSKEEAKSVKNFSRQRIYYGAPGTGKSHSIKEWLEVLNIPNENIFRTTFHPDSDYSTFVGCYKPIMKKQEERLSTNLSLEDLAQKLEEYSNDDEKKRIGGIQKFCLDYYKYIDGEYMKVNVSKLVELARLPDTYTVEINKYVKFCHQLPNQDDSKIIYAFCPQAFTNAYVKAWNTKENVYLIIEEINRGNCAQIFGDLFQLLDRDENGVSEYTIKADADLKAYLENELGKDADGIKDGELCLPSNLYIWATMNTSDQSLFPIDSAFKRRWDWEYEPIKYKNTDWVIKIGDDEYSWISLQKEVNNRIFDATNSEDKMLGDFFVKPHAGIISEKLLLNKVLFYLWNDVCKDGDGDIFRTDDNMEVKFSDLYGEKGTDILLSMMKHLGVTPLTDNIEEEDEEENNGNKDTIRYSINGNGRYAKRALSTELVKLYISQNPEMSATEVVNKWKSLGKFVSHFIETQAEFEARTDKPRVNSIPCNGENIYLSTNGWGGQGVMDNLISAIPQEWNLNVEKLPQ